MCKLQITIITNVQVTNHNNYKCASYKSQQLQMCKLQIAIITNVQVTHSNNYKCASYKSQ
jgi:hypothetical protein